MMKVLRACELLSVIFWMLDTGCWILDTGYWMLDTGYWMLDAGYFVHRSFSVGVLPTAYCLQLPAHSLQPTVFSLLDNFHTPYSIFF